MSTIPTSEEIIESVKDRDTFLQFLNAVIADRAHAEEAEQLDPKTHQWSGANGWQNTSIASFLEAASCYFSHTDCPHNKSTSSQLEWSDLANFLYFGKIYE